MTFSRKKDRRLFLEGNTNGSPPHDQSEDRVREFEQDSPLFQESPGPAPQAEDYLKSLEEKKASQKS